jgi:hypothetical protein
VRGLRIENHDESASGSRSAITTAALPRRNAIGATDLEGPPRVVDAGYETPPVKSLTIETPG